MQLFVRVVLIFVLLFQPFFTGKIVADTLDPEDSSTNEIQSVTPPATEPDPLDGLQANYFDLLELYRQQEQKYIVAKGEFLQLNTLASQEQAIRETRTLIDIRADIFLLHLEMLSMILERTTGIPLENKSPQLITLTLLKEKVQLHKVKNAQSDDRLAIDAEAAQFIPLFIEVERESYYTLGLIRIGRVQTAIDKLKFVRTAVFDHVMNQTLPAYVRSEKERGFAEIDRTIELLDQDFLPVRQQTLTKQQNSLNSDTKLSQALTETFGKMNQTVQFLEEIRR